MRIQSQLKPLAVHSTVGIVLGCLNCHMHKLCDRIKFEESHLPHTIFKYLQILILVTV